MLYQMFAITGNTLKWDEWKKGFRRAPQIPGLSKDANSYSRLVVAAMKKMGRRDRFKIRGNYLKLIADLEEMSDRKRLLKLEGSDPYQGEMWDRNAAPPMKKPRLEKRASRKSVFNVNLSLPRESWTAANVCV